jgi:hypothetical protein
VDPPDRVEQMGVGSVDVVLSFDPSPDDGD